MNQYLVSRLEIYFLLEVVEIPGVLSEIILGCAGIPLKAATCWVCCGGKLFLNAGYREFENPRDEPV